MLCLLNAFLMLGIVVSLHPATCSSLRVSRVGGSYFSAILRTLGGLWWGIMGGQGGGAALIPPFYLPPTDRKQTGRTHNTMQEETDTIACSFIGLSDKNYSSSCAKRAKRCLSSASTTTLSK